MPVRAEWTKPAAASALLIWYGAGHLCHSIRGYLHHTLASSAGQQQLSWYAVVVSTVAVRLVLELQLLSAAALQHNQALLP
jgi:hypothetical protein